MAPPEAIQALVRLIGPRHAERILVAGEMEVTYEGEPTRILKKGDYAYGPAGKPHRAKCLDSGPCVLYVGMVDPFDAVPVKE